MALRDLTPQELSDFASSNDPSLIEVDAPNNTVFDEKNDRVLSLPQTLDADETQFIIDRDIDNKKLFFAQQPIEGAGLPAPKPKLYGPGAMYGDVGEQVKSAGRGFGSFIASLPERWGGFKLEQGEAFITGRDSPFRVPANSTAGMMMSPSEMYLETDEEEKIRKRMGEAIQKDAIGIIERNRQYMAQSGWAKKEGDGIMYDIGQGSASLVASVGVAGLTRSPGAAALMFGALQKSNIYIEAREAGVEPEAASGISTLAGVVEGALEKVGLDRFMKGMAANTAMKRFVTGFVVEGVQEGSQQAAEEAITNATGIRNETGTQIAQNILYNAALGSIIGGPTNAALGALVRQDAKEQGLSDAQAAALGKYAEENIDAAKSDMGEFLRKEVAPLAADEPNAVEFMRLMQKFDNRADVVDPEALSPEERAVFDEYLDYFNSATSDKTGVRGVETDFFNKLIAAGVEQDQAVAASKLLGARADAASRALGVSPKEWYDSHNLAVEVTRTPEEAKSIYQEKLDEMRKADLASVQSSLDQARTEEAAPAGPKKPFLTFVRKRGGVSVDSELAGELRNMGITNKTAPGLFTKKKGGGELDNIPASEFNAKFGVTAKEDGNGYVDRTWLLEQIDEEMRGRSVGKQAVQRDEGFIRALEEAGLDINTATAEQVYEALGPEGDVIAQAKVMGEEINPQQAREIIGVQADEKLSSIQDAIERWQERMAIQTFNQAAFHGSPYKFDKFTTDHIGSGEGAQAYGWGLYFAGNREVAEFYRQKLAGGQAPSLDVLREYFTPGRVVKGYGGMDRVLSFNEQPDGRSWSVTVQQVVADGSGGFKDARGERARTHTTYPRAEELKAVLGKRAELGQLYQVKIPESDELLDWDKPLSKQPKPVRAALESLGMKVDDKELAAFDDALLDALNDKGDGKLPPQPKDPSGADIYKALTADSARNRRKLEDRYGDDVYGRADKLASVRLNDAGIRGIKYLDGSSRREGEGNHNFVIFDDKAVDVLETFYQGGEKPRGSITFKPDGALIELFENADASTLLHELGHLFLRDMRGVASKSKRPMVQRDYRIVKEWLGAKSDTFTEEQEEKFARGFEAYLREGKAPKPELQGIFDRFKEWLTQIYKSVRKLDVAINDDIRQVFDRMLGGDFARSESSILARGEAKVADDYARIAAPPSSTFGGDASNVIASAGQLASNIFTPVSSRLGRIHPQLKAAVRKFTFQTGLQTQQDRKRVLPFLEAMESMSEEDYRVLDFALKNRDDAKIKELVKKYKAEDAYAAVTDMLEEIYVTAKDTGMDLGYLQTYFPRMVRMADANEYLNTLRGTENWSAIAEAMAAEDGSEMWTDEEKAVFANKWLRGLPPGTTNMLKPSFTKERKVDYVEPEHNRFYLPSGEALLQYISSMRLGIAQREVFGKGENADESIGAYVASMIKQGVINHEQEAEVKLIMSALINTKGPGVFVSWVKNAGYVYLMGSPISAITQIQDLAFSLAKNGYYRTAVSLTKAVTGNSIMTKEELGIDNIAREFEDETRASRAVRLVFKAIGLEWMDNIGKQVYIESSYKRLQKEAKSNSPRFQEMLSNIFADQAKQVRQDLIDGTLSDNVKELLYSELSDVQPISLAEMPVAYLRGGNWRSLYMLKTYTAKQIDIYRREVFDKMRHPIDDPKLAGEGLIMLIRLATALMLMGMGSDALKDLILGRPITLDDLVVDNMLKTAGITKYQIYQSKQDGIANTAMQYFFVPPLYAPVDNAVKDIGDIVGKENKRTGQTKHMNPKDARSLSYVPVVGKFYYWWVGGGKAKIEKEKKKKERD